MALATQCPHCQTTFRVAHDQLKLRAGLVRCGACKEIFNGIEHLLRPGEGAPETVPARVAMPSAALPPDPPPVDAPSGTIASIAQATESVVRASESNPAPEDGYPVSDSDRGAEAPLAERLSDAADLYPAFDLVTPTAVQGFAPADDTSVDPLQRMTLIQFSYDGASDATDADQVDIPNTEPGNPTSTVAASIGDTILTDTPPLIAPAAPAADELDQAIDYLQRRPWRGTKKSLPREDIEGASEFESDAEEPGFMTRARRRAGTGAARRSWTGLLVLLLSLTALGQSIYALRDQIAARLPPAKPWLIEACTWLGCQINLPAQADAISMESNELTILNAAKNTFALALVLRNRSSSAQRWPDIELTLLDASERPVIRKVFAERDYLTEGADSAKGFAPNSEQTARITFELRQQKASNYRVYSFYP